MKGIEAIVLALAKEYHFVHPIIFSSFNYQTLKNCQRVDPHQQYCFLTKVPILFPQRFVRKIILLRFIHIGICQVKLLSAFGL